MVGWFSSHSPWKSIVREIICLLVYLIRFVLFSFFPLVYCRYMSMYRCVRMNVRFCMFFFSIVPNFLALCRWPSHFLSPLIYLMHSSLVSFFLSSLSHSFTLAVDICFDCVIEFRSIWLLFVLFCFVLLENWRANCLHTQSFSAAIKSSCVRLCCPLHIMYKWIDKWMDGS